MKKNYDRKGYVIFLFKLTTLFILQINLLWAVDCKDYQEEKNGQCSHRCENSELQIFRDGRCIQCPPGKMRGSSSTPRTGNECSFTIISCDEGDTLMTDVESEQYVETRGKQIIVDICKHGNGDQAVQYKVAYSGERFNMLDEQITSGVGNYPKPCPGKLSDSNKAGECIHKCSSDNTVSDLIWSEQENQCISCDHGKIRKTNENTCVCPDGTSYHRKKKYCLSKDIYKSIRVVKSKSCKNKSKFPKKCINACNKLKAHYEKTRTHYEEARVCGTIFQEMAIKDRLPNEWEWNGPPTIIKTSSPESISNCGSSFEICVGPASGPLRNPVTNESQEVSAMIKCYIPKNSTTCPSDIASNKDCISMIENRN